MLSHEFYELFELEYTVEVLHCVGKKVPDLLGGLIALTDIHDQFKAHRLIADLDLTEN